MTTIDDLIENLVNASKTKKPTVVITKDSTATVEQTKAWERKHGHALPDDYKCFAQKIGECFLHVQPGEATHTCSIRLMPLQEVDRYAKIVGDEENEDFAETWFAFADHHDNNWIAFDLATVKDNKVDIYDGCWEIASEPDEWELLAKSFTDFLVHIIKNGNTSPMGGGGIGFWQKPK
jgi:hypothetical protein